MKRPATPSTEPIEIQDEPGMEERFQRALRKALNTPPKHRTARAPKTKERPASKGRVHKGKPLELTTIDGAMPWPDSP
jgi:hypothetical protein